MNTLVWSVVGGFVIFLIFGAIAIFMLFKTNKSKGNYTQVRYGIKSKGEGGEMDKLEEDVFKEFEGAYSDMVEEIKRAEKDGDGIDLKDFVKSQAQRFQKLNNHFREAKIRMGGK